jgi:hypothetical protein
MRSSFAVYMDGSDLPFGFTDDVFSLQPVLSWCVQSSVVDRVVVSFGQDFDRPVFPTSVELNAMNNLQLFKEFEFKLLLMKFKDTMHDRYVSSFHLEHDDISNIERFVIVVGQEEQISSMKSRFH